MEIRNLSINTHTNVQTQPQAIQVRNLRINPPLLLAPMAGLTHSALRRIMIDFGGVGDVHFARPALELDLTELRVKRKTINYNETTPVFFTELLSHMRESNQMSLLRIIV